MNQRQRKSAAKSTHSIILPPQLKEMEEYAARREWTITGKISEIGSGKDDNRPKREELLKKAGRREIDAMSRSWAVKRFSIKKSEQLPPGMSPSCALKTLHSRLPETPEGSSAASSSPPS
jgi:hypothetical protein